MAHRWSHVGDGRWKHVNSSFLLLHQMVLGLTSVSCFRYIASVGGSLAEQCCLMSDDALTSLLALRFFALHSFANRFLPYFRRDAKNNSEMCVRTREDSNILAEWWIGIEAIDWIGNKSKFSPHEILNMYAFIELCWANFYHWFIDVWLEFLLERRNSLCNYLIFFSAGNLHSRKTFLFLCVLFSKMMLKKSLK